MSNLFKEAELITLREFKSVRGLNPVLTIKKGVIEKYIKGVPSENGRYKLGNIGARFGNYNFGIEVFKNNNEDRIKINIRAYYDEFNNAHDKVHNRLYEDGEINSFEMFLRINIISSLTFMHIIPESRLDMYIGNQTKENRAFTINHKEYTDKIRNLADEEIMTSGKFSIVFNHLWYHLSDDITGKDKTLKRISIEENLIVL